MALDILVVDDEALARQRLRTLLADCNGPVTGRIDDVASADEAIGRLRQHPYDVVLLDIQMPGSGGLELARVLRTLAAPPAIVFVTAHSQHALAAFEMDAADYLTKPVRLERLQQALAKAERSGRAAGAAAGADVLIIQDRGRTERVPLSEVLYLKAQLKYVTVRTASRSYILDGALSDLEDRYAGQFMRIHRNALVARRAVRALEKHHGNESGDDADGWAVRLAGISEVLQVSRRQLGAVRDALTDPG